VRACWDSLPDDAEFVCGLDYPLAVLALVDDESDPLVDATAAKGAVAETTSAWLEHASLRPLT